MLTVQVDAAVVHDGRRIGGKALAEDDVVRAHASGGRQKQQQGAHYPFIALGLVLYFRQGWTESEVNFMEIPSASAVAPATPIVL